MVRGWRLVFSGFALAVLAFFLNRYAEPAIYHYFPPTATITPTFTITPTPTITLTPTITDTPTITPTTSITPTPLIPPTLTAVFTSQVTPKPGAIFSQLSFTQKMNAQHLPVNPSSEFKNPVGHLYAAFSYNDMTSNAQWTALWYRGNELVHFESEPWNGSTGGYGYTDWNPPASEWLPGDYAVYIFVGMQYVQGGYFQVTGNPPGGIPPTKSPSPTPGPSETMTAASTPTASLTPSPTWTRPPTSTMRPSLTPLPTDTHWPTATDTPTPRPVYN